MKKILKNLNKNWGLDMVLATTGNCCQSCSTFNNQKMEEDFRKAKTYLQVKWYQSGMNYNGKFENQNWLWVAYDFGGLIDITTVCNDLEKALDGQYRVIKPVDDTKCIKLQKLFTIEYMAIFYDDVNGKGKWEFKKPYIGEVLDYLYPYGYCDYYVMVNQDGIITDDTYGLDNVGEKLELKYPELYKIFKNDITIYD